MGSYTTDDSGLTLSYSGGSGAAIVAAAAEGRLLTVRILIADDNPVFLGVLQVMLTNWGYTVVSARDGEEAWQVLRAENAPRLAILDWMMPGLDGIEVCRLVRAGAGRSVYVLILTAKTQSEDLVTAMQAGADDYVTKPLKSQELRIRLAAARRILDLEERLSLAGAAPQISSTG